MKILVLANFGMGLYKFRKELLEELIKQSNDVYISFPHDEYVFKLKSLGCEYLESNVDRRGTNPVTDMALILTYIKIIRRIKPDVVLTYTIKPNVYGGIACRITKTPYLTNITGLGTSIENKGLMQKVALGLYRIGLKESRCVFFQNEPNKQFFTKKKVVKRRTRLIPGSGVNLKHHVLEEYPNNTETIKFLFIGRIMKAKGIDELLKAAKIVKEKYLNVQFDLIGFIEEDYTEQLKEYEKNGVVNYHGPQNDVHKFIRKAHATILPSYHEGTANVLLESASSGRPVLASKVTGCIETFDEGISGFGFKVKSVDSLVEAIIRFINLPDDKKKAIGIAGRKKMEKEFDRCIVINAYIEELNSLKEN
ncbi:glycosyltransferase family 4 protein [Marinisporobacter balticus]|uniref:Galacturonosyltransferase n=1 Tax=Marinisporobacter balticus TaxID=2018667 RepID=A0A4R2L000_9FIRM|nr:glycosyltransferase family 4 protein [Marinisporobacter balticus]TCO78822.1 galacturonosyltransferase [Marinisporobacter balticus]